MLFWTMDYLILPGSPEFNGPSFLTVIWSNTMLVSESSNQVFDIRVKKCLPIRDLAIENNDF